MLLFIAYPISVDVNVENRSQSRSSGNSMQWNQFNVLTAELTSRIVVPAHVTNMSNLIAYVDGGSLGNPGPSGIGVVIDGSASGTIKIRKWIGHQDNNVAEYVALLEALQCALELSARALHVFSDSEVMVKQMTGEYSCRSSRLYSLHWTCRKLARSLDFSISHIPRENNVEANRLANSAVRRRTSIIGKIVGPDAVILIGKDATETAFKKEPLDQFRLLHLAVHGFADTQYPERSALVLGADPKSGDDGLLQVREIIRLRLNADLTTLSDCDSGVGISSPRDSDQWEL
jgi:ribonuclease HI